MVTRTRAPRRAMQWQTNSFGVLTTVGANQVFQLSESIPRKGATVARCIVRLSLEVTGSDSVFAWGTWVGNTNQTDANKPNPLTPAEVAWLCWDSIETRRESGGSQHYIHFAYDIRSQRKFRSDDEQLFLIVRTSTVMNAHLAVRTLFFLP